jgi:hypothetical protein
VSHSVRSSPIKCNPDLSSRIAIEKLFSFFSREFIEQRRRLLQVFGVKPFSEPIVNLREQLSGFFLLALLLLLAG